MIYASDFRKGITFEMNGEPHVWTFSMLSRARALLL